MSLLDDLKADVSAALTGELRSATYYAWEVTGYDPDYNEPIYGWTPHDCEGVRGYYDPATAGLAGIPRDSARIEILASSLAVEPDEMGRIGIEDRFWQITHLETDPATAVWVCECTESTDPTA